MPMEHLATPLYLLTVLGLAIAGVLWRFGLKAYTEEKGKNLATKEDVSKITELVESTKATIQRLNRVDERKYELKYEACLNALKILDAQLSHVLTTDNDGKPATIVKQTATAEEVRSCHNALILTVDNPNIVSTFLDILTGQSKNPVVALDTIRADIKSELGFIGKAPSDTKRTWLGKGIPE